MGVDGMTILYRWETGTFVTNMLVLDEDYKGVDVGVRVSGCACAGSSVGWCSEWSLILVRAACLPPVPFRDFCEPRGIRPVFVRMTVVIAVPVHRRAPQRLS
jgi:hypothetical protein